VLDDGSYHREARILQTNFAQYDALSTLIHKYGDVLLEPIRRRILIGWHRRLQLWVPRISPFDVNLSNDERATLESMARKYTSPYCDVIRAKIILLADEGLSNDVIAARLDTPRQIVSKWRKRFALARLPGLEAQPRGGRKARFSPQPRRSS
jgi:hypothetical protein